MLAENVVDIDTYQDFNLRYITQLFTQLEITRSTKKAHDCKKTVESSHFTCNAFELIEKGIAGFVIKKLCTHAISKFYRAKDFGNPYVY